jgi:transposase InsO family protein
MEMAYTTNENAGKVRVQAIRMIRAGKSTREVARYFGYGQSTIVKWWKRRNEVWKKRILPTRSSRPHTSPKSISKDIVAKILAIRRDTKRCSEVVYQYLKIQNVKVSLSTVKRTLSRYGMLKKRSPWKKVRKYPIRPDIQKQGDLVQFDTIHFVDKHEKRSYVYTALDVYSRYGFAVLSPKANCHRSISFLKKAIEYFPFQIGNVQTDNGPEFGLHFTRFVTRHKITHRHIHPRSPNENGHLERFNRTIQEEIGRFGWCIFIPKDIKSFLHHYNTERLHMGINFKTPAQLVQK